MKYQWISRLLIASTVLQWIACNTKNEKKESVEQVITIRKVIALAGEPSIESIILQARLLSSDSLVNNDLPGISGWGYFELSESPSFSNAIKTKWLQAVLANDFQLKTKVEGLKPNTAYFYRPVYGKDSVTTQVGATGKFKTLPGKGNDDDFNFIVASCMNYESFLGISNSSKTIAQSNPNYQEASTEDKKLGYPGFETILQQHQPAFWVGDGDNVYYDVPKDRRAKTQEELRSKWHRLFAFSRTQKFFQEIPSYWLKDDHDYRNNDSSPHDDWYTEPSHELGVYTFREQIPVVDLNDKNAVTYRTYRVNDHLQIWFLEGRDYRSSNKLSDGPSKTIWGKEQLNWLRKTLSESDATFKVIISPTPLVGPDDHRLPGDTNTLDKRDNHADIGGFKYEGDAFFKWLKENKFNEKELFFVNGDRHWQYHSVHPFGYNEFGTGAFVKQNARIGRKPGEKNSSDPTGLVKQPFIQEKPTGAFLKIAVEPTPTEAKIRFQFIEETGPVLYQHEVKKILVR